MAEKHSLRFEIFVSSYLRPLHPVPANTNVWQCTLPLPTATNTALPTATNTPEPTATDTPVPTATNTLPPVNNRAIAAVRLSSNQPGVLEVSWDSPSESPRDYRISWAKVGENFKTWTDSSGNAFPTSASHTITGLDKGVRYKVTVRARYQDGSGELEFGGRSSGYGRTDGRNYFAPTTNR